MLKNSIQQTVKVYIRKQTTEVFLKGINAKVITRIKIETFLETNNK